MKELKRIDFYCENCKKSLKISYDVSGDKEALVMSGITLRCHTHKCVRTMTFKKYTEGQLVTLADKEGKVFV